MDVDVQAPSQGDKSTVDDSVQNTASMGETNGPTKDKGKHSMKVKGAQTRSRSSTPQNKEETKSLHISLKNIGNELNGKDLQEEIEKSEDKRESKSNKGKLDNCKDQINMVDELVNDNEKKTKKQNGDSQKDEEKPKEEKSKISGSQNKSVAKKDEIEKNVDSPKQDSSKKDSSKKALPKNDSPKKDSPKKDSPKKDSPKEDSTKKDSPKKDSPKKDSPKRDPPKKDSPKRETPKKRISPKLTDESLKREKRDKTKKEELGPPNNETETENVEMDPLVISDEPDPELEFDDSSDIESEKESPIISRCLTRRSQTRNIPTPKTPKSIDQDVDSEKNSSTATPTEMAEVDIELPKTDNLNDSHDSFESIDISTRAEAGSDATRMAYVNTHDSNYMDDSYLNTTRERSLGETLRCLSARRPIRSTADYRKQILRSTQEKYDLNIPYSSRNSVEQVRSSLKRKSRSNTPEEKKRFKGESLAANPIFSSPLSNFRNKFRSDLPSSTPKLLAYKEKSGLHYGDDEPFGEGHNGDDEKKSWCSIM